MIYIIRSDFIILKKNLVKILIYYFLPLLSCILISKFSNAKLNITWLNIFSFNLTLSENLVVEIILYLLFICSNIYMVYLLFVNDFQNDMCNIFLRLESKKWITYKIFSIALYVFVVNTIRFIFGTLMSILFCEKIFLLYHIKAYIYIMLFSYMFIYFTYMFKNKNYNISAIISLLLLLVVFPKNIVGMNIYIMLVLLCIIILLLVFNTKRNFASIVEGSKLN